jgi:hypothetical protein
MNRSVARRLQKLEGRFAPSEKPPEIIIKLIGPSGAVTGTLRFDEGRQQWLPSEIDSTDEAPIIDRGEP